MGDDSAKEIISKICDNMLTGDGEEIGAQADRDALQCEDGNQAQGCVLNQLEVTVPECIIDDDPDRLRIKKS